MINRKILLLVPHQDDEINLIGNIFKNIADKYELFVLYSALDKNPTKGNIRKREAINACAVFGVKSDHITFLEYPDTPNYLGKHYFTDGDRSIIFVLRNYIRELTPSVIFAVDFDYHADHRVLSLAFEEAMGILLKENPNYKPIVLKGFCYETAFWGLKDYKASRPEPTKVIGEIKSNRSLEWENRISLYGTSHPAFVWNTQVYKALAQHRSQLAKLNARSIINSDNVFWLKRTDNVMLQATISCESGDVSKLNDFMILDTDNIFSKDPDNIDYSRGLWRIESNAAELKIRWDHKIIIDRFVFHGSLNQKSDQKMSIIVVTGNNDKLCELNSLKAYGRNTEVQFPKTETDSIRILLKTDEKQIELSEIEAFYGEQSIGNLEENVSTPADSEIKGNSLIDFLNYAGCKLIALRVRGWNKVIGIFNKK